MQTFLEFKKTASLTPHTANALQVCPELVKEHLERTGTVSNDRFGPKASDIFDVVVSHRQPEVGRGCYYATLTHGPVDDRKSGTETYDGQSIEGALRRLLSLLTSKLGDRFTSEALRERKESQATDLDSIVE
jgi:hypothetical protein